MAIPFSAAASAYSNAAKLINQAAKPATDLTASAAQGPDFAKLLSNTVQSVTDGAGLGTSQSPDFAKILSDTVQSVVNKGKASDQKTMDLVNGKANVVDVVTSVAQTEVAVQSMVAVRDRVISAYEEIMRMPI
jgi:flagellar hook-basal body complex protein FliE